MIIKKDDIVVVCENGKNKIGKVLSTGRKNKNKVYTVIMENGTIHSHIQADAPHLLYYINTSASNLINSKNLIQLEPLSNEEI